MKEQCEATTKASTYSEAHRCLKMVGAPPPGKKPLCAHHQGKRRAS